MINRQHKHYKDDNCYINSFDLTLRQYKVDFFTENLFLFRASRLEKLSIKQIFAINTILTMEINSYFFTVGLITHCFMTQSSTVYPIVL